MAQLHQAFNESERADGELVKVQLANLEKGIVNDEGEIWDADPDYGQLVGVQLDDGNYSDITDDPCSGMSSSDSSDSSDSDVESCPEPAPNSSVNSHEPESYRKCWRTKSSSNETTDLDSTDSSENQPKIEGGASGVSHPVMMFRVVEQDQNPNSNGEVVPWGKY